MKYTKKCPECGGTDIYVNESVCSQGALNGINFLPDVSGQVWGRGSMELYVCGDCGRYAFFVPESTLEAVRKKWPKYS